MEWDRVRIFLAVARSRQMLAAAKSLGLNHATVGRQLTQLEDELQTKLIERHINGCTLTPAGEALLDRLRALDDAGFVGVDQSRGLRVQHVPGVGPERAEHVRGVTEEDRQLVVRGRQAEVNGKTFLHRGIAARQFLRSFVLADGIEVAAAALQNGLLRIDLARKHVQPNVRVVDIKTGGLP